MGNCLSVNRINFDLVKKGIQEHFLWRTSLKQLEICSLSPHTLFCSSSWPARFTLFEDTEVPRGGANFSFYFIFIEWINPIM